MLFLDRHEGERIRIGGDIWIVVVKAGSSVRLGIDAPEDIVILREELIGEDEAGNRVDKSGGVAQD